MNKTPNNKLTHPLTNTKLSNQTNRTDTTQNSGRYSVNFLNQVEMSQQESNIKL